MFTETSGGKSGRQKGKKENSILGILNFSSMITPSLLLVACVSVCGGERRRIREEGRNLRTVELLRVHCRYKVKLK